MYKQSETNVINTINSIAAYGRAHASEYQFEENSFSFAVDTDDAKEVTAIVKTICVWLVGKNQDIYVERFCGEHSTQISIENPMLKHVTNENGATIVEDYRGFKRDGSCQVDELNTHEADGDEIENHWNKVKPGAFRNWVNNTLVRVDGSFVNIDKVEV